MAKYISRILLENFQKRASMDLIGKHVHRGLMQEKNYRMGKTINIV